MKICDGDYQDFILIGQPRPLLVYFQLDRRKTSDIWLDSNSARQSIGRAYLPIDNHYGPM